MTADDSFDGATATINTYLPNAQGRSAIFVDADGDGAVCWTGEVQDGSGLGVFSRRFAGPAPTPIAPRVNGGSPQRSKVTSTSASFHRVLTLPANPAAAFELTGPAGPVPVAVSLAGSTASGSNITLTFPGQPGGSLPDGRYTLRMLASQVHDSAGQMLDGNGDGIPGDDFVMSFHRLLGDFDGNGAVDAFDFGAFRTAFGTSNVTFDLDGDGQVSASDFGLFRARFGMTV